MSEEGKGKGKGPQDHPSDRSMSREPTNDEDYFRSRDSSRGRQFPRDASDERISSPSGRLLPRDSLESAPPSTSRSRPRFYAGPFKRAKNRYPTERPRDVRTGGASRPLIVEDAHSKAVVAQSLNDKRSQSKSAEDLLLLDERGQNCTTSENHEAMANVLDSGSTMIDFATTLDQGGHLEKRSSLSTKARRAIEKVYSRTDKGDSDYWRRSGET